MIIYWLGNSNDYIEDDQVPTMREISNEVCFEKHSDGMGALVFQFDIESSIDIPTSKPP